jgi:hypothetical protein
MTTNDLTNLRWQYIRSVEANQLLQDEIISLKSIVKSKEAQESISKSEQIKQQNQMKIFVQNLTKKFNLIKNELNMTKKLYVTDMSLTNSDLVKLRSSILELDWLTLSLSLHRAIIKKIDNLNYSSTKRLTTESETLAAKLAELEKITQSRMQRASGDITTFETNPTY